VRKGVRRLAGLPTPHWHTLCRVMDECRVTSPKAATLLAPPLQRDWKFAMDVLATQCAIVGAAGYSLLYLILGGGFVGAVVIFFVAKLLGK
jgi:hypothetical protein